MQIAELGEFALIDRLNEGVSLVNAATLTAAGDDCAVMAYPATRVLATTDLMLEGIDFDLVYTPLRHLGYKAAMAGMSNIYAMNGTPRQLLVGLGVSNRFEVEDLDELYAGLRMACERHNVDLVGGDTSASLTGLTLALTTIGDVAEADLVGRDGAHDTDLVCVSGNLGAAYMGLQLMEREKAVYYAQIEDYNKKVRKAQADKDEAKLNMLREQRPSVEDFQPDFAGKEYLLDRQLKPEARGDIIQKLNEEHIRPTAMIDISDGLSSELMHICKQSHCGCRVYEKEIPIDYQTAVTAEQFNMNLTTCALNGGEDYELLFTVPIGDYEKIKEIEGIRQIGYITKESLGCMLVTRDNNEFELQAQGWNPLRDE